MHIISKECEIYNYADDNTIFCSGDDPISVKGKLEHAAHLMLEWFKENHMQANPSNFQMIMFKRRPITCTLNVDEIEVTSGNLVKLLGVEFDDKLKFSVHISSVCKKVGKQVSVIGRLAKTLTTDAKLMLFNAFILSHFNYCPLVWNFYSLADLKKMEKLQFRALRFVYNDFTSSYTELRNKAGKPLLYVQRQRQLIRNIQNH